MEEIIDPLSGNGIENIIQTAQSFIGRSTLALQRAYPRSRRKHADSDTYCLMYTEASIVWLTNIFGICDISLIQFNSMEDVEKCCDFCNHTLEIIKPNLWIDQDTIIQYYTEASGQNNFMIGWKYSSILR